MKKFTDYASTTSTLFLVPFLTATVFCLFNPSFFEYSLSIIVDTIAALIIVPLGNKLFSKFYPDVKDYFYHIDDQKLSHYTLEEKTKLYNSLIAFPLRRSLFYYFLNLLKIIPPGIVIIFFWKYDGTKMEQFLKFVVWEIPVQVFAAGTIFVEFHIFVSKQIKEIHEKIDLSEVFRNANPTASEKSFFKYESIAFLSLVFTLMVTLSVTFFVIPQDKSFFFLFVLTTILGHLLIARLYFLNRKFINEGLSDILMRFKNFDSRNPHDLIALSSSGFLARFSKVFNELTFKLQQNERELAQWIVKEVDESRYRTVGEIAGMVAHDLRSPLNTVSFCVEELKENPHKIHNERFMQQLSINAERSVELVKSLMAYLKNHSRDEKESFFNSFNYVKNILATQYPSERFNMITFNIDPRLNETYLQMSRIDLIHVLNNLMQNSITNLIRNDIPCPTISIQHAGYQNGKILISYSDNGTGLTLHDFEDLTSFGHSSSFADDRNKQGLGLRLTRRLIERNNGELEFIEKDYGTSFNLSLADSFKFQDFNNQNHLQ